MRLSILEQDFLYYETKKLIPKGRVYIFGSRADDSKKGGDKDVLIVGDRRLTLKEKHQLIVDYWKKFGEQKLDILSRTLEDDDAFYMYIKENAIEIKPR